MTTRLGDFIRSLSSSLSSRTARRLTGSTFRRRDLINNLESRLLLAATPFYHAGDLDPTFGTPDPSNPGQNTGSITTPILVNGASPTVSYPTGFWGYANVYKSALQTGGVSSPQMVVVSTVGVGSLTTATSPYAPDPLSPITDSHGNPIVVGTAISIERYDVRTGAIDAGFTRSLTLPAYFNGRSLAMGGVAIQADGKIVIAGTTSPYPMYTTAQYYDVNAFVIRLNADGSYDTTFDTEGKVDGTRNDGVVIYDFARGQETINSVALGAGGRIYIGGSVTVDPGLAGNSALLVSFNPDGSIDNTFGTDGRFVGKADAAEPPAILPTVPRYWVSAMYGDTYFNDSYMAQGFGAVDPTTPLSQVLPASGLSYYVYSGPIHVKIGQKEFDVDLSTAVTLQDVADLINAELVNQAQTATVTLQTSGNTATYVLQADATNSFEISNPANSSSTTADDLGLTGTAAANKTFTSAPLFGRAEAFPGANQAYNYGQVPGVNDRFYDDQFQQMIVQPDGKVIAAGQVYGGTPSNTKLLVARFNPNGTLDTTFGTGGYFIRDISAGDANGGGEDVITSLALRPDAAGWDVVFAGYSTPASAVGITGQDAHWSRLPPTETLIGVLNPNGMLDTTFNLTGYELAYYPGTPASSFFTSVQLQSDGKIVAVGSARSTAGQGTLVVRYNANGTLDNNFGVAGVAIARLDSTTTGGYWYPGDYNDKSKTKHPAEYYPTGAAATDLPINVYIDPVNGSIELVGYSVTTPPFYGQSIPGKQGFTPGAFYPIVPYQNGTGSPFPMDFIATIGQMEFIRFTNDTPNYQTDTVAPLSLLQPTAALTNPNAATYTFQVLYNDNDKLKLTSFDANDLYVTGPNGYRGQAIPIRISIDAAGTTAASLDGSPIYVTYQIARPTQGWVTGQYFVHLNAAAVTDISGNYAVGGLLGAVNVFVPDTDTPKAALSITDILPGGATTKDFTVTYTDLFGINVLSLGNNNISVTGPNGFYQKATLVSYGPPYNNNSVTATYRITTTGAWAAGTYTVSINPAQVGDTAYPLNDARESYDPTNITDTTLYPTQSHFVVGGALGSFKAIAADVTAPQAFVQALAVTSPASYYQFTVTYTDNVAVNAATLGNNDITVTGPNGYTQAATLIGVTPAGNGSPLTAVYRVPAPGGMWDPTDNGTYTVTLNAGAVTDTSNNPAATVALGTFTAAVVPDTTAPLLTGFAGQTQTTKTSAYYFALSFSDDNAINVQSLSGANVTVIGPNNQTFAAQLAGVDNPGDGTPRAAVYRLVLPAGASAFDSNFNGSYTVYLNANQVTDLSGNAVAAQTVGTFTFNIPDSDAPRATVTATPVSTSAAVYVDFAVTYTDASGVKVSTLDANDIVVVDPSGTVRPVSFVGVDYATNGSPRTASYRLSGTWTNGTYTIRLKAGQVSDTLGNASGADETIGTANLRFSNTAPSAALTFADFAGLQNGGRSFDVYFNDPTGLSVPSVSNGSVITVVAPGNRLVHAAFVGIDNNTGAATHKATYRVMGTGLGWSERDAGAYQVFLNGQTVSDLQGNFMPQTFLGTFYYSPSPFFNERYYLATNPDVAAGVAAGALPSGYQHFVAHGQFEHRNPSPFYNDAYYLSHNPDVAQGVAQHLLASGWQHYALYGSAENRTASPYFDANYYLSRYADIRAGVANGSIRSAVLHYIQNGLGEGRSPSPLVQNTYYLSVYGDIRAAVAQGRYHSGLEHFFNVALPGGETRVTTELFSQSYYLSQNRDVAQGVATGAIRSAFDHFMTFGMLEGRVATADFNASDYLSAYTDVGGQIAAGQVPSALYQYAGYGQFSHRNPSSSFDELYYLASNPDVASAVGAGYFTSGFEHYLIFGRAEGRSAHA